MRLTKWIAGLFLACAANLASSGIIVDIYESGSDVTALFDGSIDLNATSPAGGNLSWVSAVAAELGLVLFEGSGQRYDLNFLESDGTWGSGVGGLVLPDSVSGSAFYFFVTTPVVLLPDGYVSESNISGSMRFNNRNLATMGLNPGEYNYTFGQPGAVTDFVTVNIGQERNPVPSPGTSTLLALGLVVLGFRRSLRRR